MQTPTRFALRMGLFYAGYLVVQGAQLPFFPVWLAARGLDPAEISVCIALPIALRILLQPAAGAFADRAPSRRFAIRLFTVAAVALFVPAWFFSGFWPILLFTAASGVLWSLAFPAAEALALTGVRRLGLDYGRMRIPGSVTFIAANLAAGGVLGLFAPEAIFWLVLGLLGVSAAVSFALPLPPAAAPDDPVPVARPPVRVVFAHPALLAALLAGGLIQGSHSALYSFGTIHWRGLGLSGPEIGALWAIGVVAEIVVFSMSRAMWRVLGARGLVALGGGAAVLRWTLAALEPGFLGLLPLQALHGLTFGATYLGVQRVIVARVPDEITGAAQGLNQMVLSLTMVAGTLLSGPLYAALGAHAFLAMALPAGLGLLILVLRRVALAEPAASPSPAG